MLVCMGVGVYRCGYGRVWVCMGVGEYVCGCLCVGVYGYGSVWVDVGVYVYGCACVGVYASGYVCGCVCGWMGVCGCVFVWVWVCVSVGVLGGGLAGWDRDGMGWDSNPTPFDHESVALPLSYSNT